MISHTLYYSTQFFFDNELGRFPDSIFFRSSDSQMSCSGRGQTTTKIDTKKRVDQGKMTFTFFGEPDISNVGCTMKSWSAAASSSSSLTMGGREGGGG